MSAFSLYLVNDHKNDFHHIDFINPQNFTSKKYESWFSFREKQEECKVHKTYEA